MTNIHLQFLLESESKEDGMHVAIKPSSRHSKGKQNVTYSVFDSGNHYPSCSD